MIRISQQQQGEMFSNTIFIIFNNQHRHCNIVHRWMQSYKNMQQSATVLAVHCSSEYNHIKIPQPPIYNTQNIYNWKQCNWQHANTTERCSIWYILYNNQPQCLSHIYKELSVKISITEWQCILKPTVIANKSDLSIGAGVFIHNKMFWYHLLHWCHHMWCNALFFFKLIQTEVQLAIILRQIQNELDSMYTRWYLHPKKQRGTVTIKQWPQCLKVNVVECTIFWCDDTQQHTML